MGITHRALGAALACAAIALFGFLVGTAAAAKGGAAAPRIEVLSGRADLVSAGDTLVRVTPPKGSKGKRLRLFAGRRDVTGNLTRVDGGALEGLVTDLREGRNRLVARSGKAAAKLIVTNHPNGGPLFSGPQVKPWVCQESAVDAKCNQPPEYEFQYVPAGGGGFRPFDPENPPSNVARTTTDQGQTVPFIIRIETGYQNRDQYKIAVLYDPEQPWTATRPQPGWNHKLLITHGASCGIDHEAGDAPSVTSDTIAAEGVNVSGSSPQAALSRGFAVMSTALNNAGHNCNLLTQAESLVMAKERLVEQYGQIRYTIGTGCSGGSLTQQQVANAYPGIYQGILPQCSFPDAWSTGQQLAAYHLIRDYVEDPSKWAPGVVWTPAEIAAIEGHPNHVNSIVFDTVYWTSLADPTSNCAGVTDAERYHPQTNPGGARCTLADYMINVFGPRSKRLWGPQERQLGRGFAPVALGDVGVQFGLLPLMGGQITPAQFVDLNTKIGGADIDLGYTPERLDAPNKAMARAYRSGAINTGSNLDEVAIIDLRGPDPGAFHDAYRSWAIRARLEREHGTYANHVIWFGPTPLIGDPGYTTEGLFAMDRWLSAVEADRRKKVPLSRKIIEHRPEDVNDRCAHIPGVEAVEVPGQGPVCELDEAQTKYGTPLTAAGEGIATDTNECALRPLNRTDYYPVEFTDAQWAQLQQVFPTGVCDFSRPGPGQQDTIPWQTYQDVKGRVVFGGEPMGKAPRSRPLR
jgi:hypothetical protein